MRHVLFDEAEKGEKLVAVEEHHTGCFIFYRLEDGETPDEALDAAEEKTVDRGMDVKGIITVEEFFDT
jgi:hypothetical protein